MKAAYYTGDQSFTIREDQPKEPQAGEARVKIAYCGICGTDLHVYHGAMDARVTTNRVVGHECSGIVDALGEGVEGFEVGDQVVIRPLASCGECPACKKGYTHVCQKLKFLGLDTEGAFQQAWTLPANTLHKVPADMRLDFAALIEPTAVACHDVARANIQPGEDVLVIGGGPIGLLVAMVAKQAGGNVVVSEVSEYRLGIAEKLGFKTLNAMKVNVAEEVWKMTGDKGAEVVFEVSATQPGVDTMTEAAAVRGRIVMVGIIGGRKPEVDLFKFFWRELQLLGARVYEAADYEKAIELIVSGAIDCETLITDIQELEDITKAFQALDGNATAMKSLIKCS
ncbi:putative zinc-type alcohol dehydrogenase-like protein YjmD [Pontiella desulfatans]|uniref:Putative zinc-type alcohol dehydrogenase-like protein YjmD n=1 Tax=Pontiella desulfatans TaxID=2750659 RepID=A0A6C2U7U2_PONDE|nr:alcohol dehydrogenase catalytic domain-containing protein [Pontiella desulfatans]VGO15476.1 putative zinc-type alcohol dehydrogenase-like protein YjmD [Pontiella desulfatans]